MVILVGQLKNDRISERHSFEVTSIENMLAQDHVSDDWVDQRPVDISVFNAQLLRKEGEHHW